MGLAQQGDAEAQKAAEALFHEARDLMAAGQYTDACPKLEQSLALYPTVGSRLNLALCYERSDRPASAWRHYREVVAQEGQGPRADVARQHAAALEPSIPRLVVRAAPAAASIAGLVVTRDGVLVQPAEFGAAIYVDPGEHTLRAEAPGHRPFQMNVRVQKGEQVVVVVPTLEPEPASEPTPEPASEPTPEPDSAADATPDASPTPAGAPVEGAESPIGPAPEPGSGLRRTVAWTAGGGGGVLLVVGLGFGLAANSAWDDARDIGRCDATTLVCEDSRGPGLVDTARSRARVSSIAVGAGAALLATGAVFFYLSREPADAAGHTRVMPVAGADGVGVALSGEF
ncbi:hypothetical protein [Haliangium sp.]|uniref:hypothetical protein n=1 Tax=Haliangium sp. TaxID=2663208 RepID=UPI003D0E07B1